MVGKHTKMLGIPHRYKKIEDENIKHISEQIKELDIEKFKLLSKKITEISNNKTVKKCVENAESK